MSIKIKDLEQSKKMVATLQIINVCSGMLIAFTIQQAFVFGQEWIQTYIWSDFVCEISLKSNLIVTIVLTVVSILRGYIWTRLFVKLHTKKLTKTYGGELNDEENR